MMMRQRIGISRTCGCSWLLCSSIGSRQRRWGKHCEERGRALDRKNDVTRLYAKVRGTDWRRCTISTLVDLRRRRVVPTNQNLSIPITTRQACQGVGAEMGVPVVDLWSLLGGADMAKVAPNVNDGLHLSGRWVHICGFLVLRKRLAGFGLGEIVGDLAMGSSHRQSLTPPCALFTQRECAGAGSGGGGHPEPLPGRGPGGPAHAGE